MRFIVCLDAEACRADRDLNGPQRPEGGFRRALAITIAIEKATVFP
jgi:hypothetical protein